MTSFFFRRRMDADMGMDQKEYKPGWVVWCWRILISVLRNYSVTTIILIIFPATLCWGQFSAQFASTFTGTTACSWDQSQKLSHLTNLLVSTVQYYGSECCNNSGPVFKMVDEGTNQWRQHVTSPDRHDRINNFYNHYNYLVLLCAQPGPCILNWRIQSKNIIQNMIIIKSVSRWSTLNHWAPHSG